jgi:cell division septum initiation protein DivIVA
MAKTNPAKLGKSAIRMKATAFCGIIALFSGATAFALSDLEIREKRSAEINAVKKTACADEAPDILKRIEYSAALVFHNELEEARSSLSSAMEQAKSQSCKEELLKVIKAL